MNFRKAFTHLLFTGALSCGSFLTFAQGAYLKAGGGYNFGIGSQSTVSATTHITNDASSGMVISERVQRVSLNYGKGLTGNVAAGYMFCDRFGAELEASYLAGGNNESFLSLTYASQPETPIFRKYNSYAQMLLLQPSFILSAGLAGPLNVYGKFGVTAARGTVYSNRYSLDENGEHVTEAIFTDGWGFGLLGALGVTYKVTEKVDLYSEIKMSNLSYSPRFYTIKKETMNGQDITPDQPNTELVNSYSMRYSGEPAINIKEAFPFGSVGLNIGLKYNF